MANAAAIARTWRAERSSRTLISASGATREQSLAASTVIRRRGTAAATNASIAIASQLPSG